MLGGHETKTLPQAGTWDRTSSLPRKDLPQRTFGSILPGPVPGAINTCYQQGPSLQASRLPREAVMAWLLCCMLLPDSLHICLQHPAHLELGAKPSTWPVFHTDSLGAHECVYTRWRLALVSTPLGRCEHFSAAYRACAQKSCLLWSGNRPQSPKAASQVSRLIAGNGSPTLVSHRCLHLSNLLSLAMKFYSPHSRPINVTDEYSYSWQCREQQAGTSSSLLKPVFPDPSMT